QIRRYPEAARRISSTSKYRPLKLFLDRRFSHSTRAFRVWRASEPGRQNWSPRLTNRQRQKFAIGSFVLLLRVFAKTLADVFRPEDIAGSIGRYTFAARLIFSRVRSWNEGSDGAVFGAADADAAPAPRIGSAPVLILGLGIGQVDHIVFVDEDRAWPTELFPFG